MSVSEKQLIIPVEAFQGRPDAGAHYALVEITTHHPKQPNWARPMRVYLRNSKDTPSVVGIERE
jgi:hypothetical protein